MNSMIPRPDDNPFHAYARAVAQRRLDGKRLHFSRDGKWLVGENEPIEAGARRVAIVSQLRIGWLKWQAQKPVDECTGLVSEGFEPPRRHEMGDLDEALWEKNPDGTSKDPWQKVNLLPLVSPESYEVFTYSTPSKGGFSAIGELCAGYANDGEYPLVLLEAGSYMHRIKTYGRIWYPVFTVLKYVPAARFDDALASARGERISHPIEVEDDEQAPPEAPPPRPVPRPVVTSGRRSAPAHDDSDDGRRGPDPDDYVPV